MHSKDTSMPFKRYIHAFQKIYPCHSKDISMPFKRYIHAIQNIYPCHSKDISMPFKIYTHAIQKIYPCHSKDISMPFKRYIHAIQKIYPCHSKYISMPFKIYIHAIQNIYPCHSKDISMPFKIYIHAIQKIHHAYLCNICITIVFAEAMYACHMLIFFNVAIMIKIVKTILRNFLISMWRIKHGCCDVYNCDYFIISPYPSLFMILTEPRKPSSLQVTMEFFLVHSSSSS